MKIEELHELTERQVNDLRVLMHELSARIDVDADMLRRVVAAPSSHLFAMTEEDGHIIGTASLCVFDAPTGRKGHVEDVVVLSEYRGRGLGRQLLEHLIDYARKELVTVDLYLTSKPSRIAANALYRSLGFQTKETNVYKMIISPSESETERVIKNTRS